MNRLNERHVVICVDDDPGVLAALSRSLRSEPYQLLTTEQPEVALRWIESRDVSAVVSDQKMPGMTGTEFLAEVSARSPDTARIMLTAYAEDLGSLPKLRLRQSIECLIAKPWDDGSLRQTIREFLFTREIEDPRGGDKPRDRKGAKAL